MYHRYIIKQRDGKGFSFGYTTDISKVMKNAGRTNDWQLLYHEVLKTKEEATKKEITLQVKDGNLAIYTSSIKLDRVA